MKKYILVALSGLVFSFPALANPGCCNDCDGSTSDECCSSCE